MCFLWARHVCFSIHKLHNFAGGFHYLQLVDSNNQSNIIVDVCVLVYHTEIAQHGSSNRLIAKVHGCKVHAVCNFVYVTILQNVEKEVTAGKDAGSPPPTVVTG